MKFRVSSGDLKEDIETDSPESAVELALTRMRHKRKRFSLALKIDVATVEQRVSYVTEDVLKKLGEVK